MPIEEPFPGRYRFFCVNRGLSSHRNAQGAEIASMVADPDWLTLVGVEPPRMKPLPGVLYDDTVPRLNLTRGQPVRAYRCSVCGYLELYDAHEVDPKMWGP
jgi:hypothetical protein